MIYNRIRRELYNNVKDAAEKVGTSEESIISNLLDGSYICIRKQNLLKYLDNGMIDIPYNEVNKHLTFLNYEIR